MTSKTGLRLISLNIEGNLHYELVLPFLKQRNSDVICLQEVIEDDIKLIAQRTAMKIVRYVPLVRFKDQNNARMPKNCTWGMLCLVKQELEVTDIKVEYYKRITSELPEYSNNNPNIVNRAIIAATVIKNGSHYRVITTHFTWSPNGQPIPQQNEDMRKLLSLLAKEKEFVLCGDTNAPRGGPIWQKLAAKYHDFIPRDVKTTLDKKLHKAANNIGDYVVDCLFSTPEYDIKEVAVKKGVSDHMAIDCVIKRNLN